MQTIKIDLSEELKEIEIHTFADLHIGEASCDLKGIKEHIKEVEEKENAVAILNGDLINNALKTSISDIYNETMTPSKEIETCIELFTPIKDKIICITSGNHEDRTKNGTSISPMEFVAARLGISDKFAQIGAVIFLRFGWNKNRKRKQWYSIYTTHGRGGGRKEGSKANRLAEMASIVDCDIYIHSHTHLPMIIKEGFYRTDFINSNVSYVDKLFVNTSSMLDYGGYGQVGEFKPNSKHNPVIILDGEKKNFKAIL